MFKFGCLDQTNREEAPVHEKYYRNSRCSEKFLGLSFDPDVLFEERLTAEHRGFLAFLPVVEEHLPVMATTHSHLGRPRYDNVPFFQAYLAKHIYPKPYWPDWSGSFMKGNSSGSSHATRHQYRPGRRHAIKRRRSKQKSISADGHGRIRFARYQNTNGQLDCWFRALVQHRASPFRHWLRYTTITS